MREVVWQTVPELEGCRVGFTMPCWGRYGWGCGHRGYRDLCTRGNHEAHGHIHISDGESEGRVPFCVYSRIGVAAILQVLVQKEVIGEKERQAIMNLPEVKALPRNLTKAEKQVLRSPEKRKRDTSFLCHG